MMSRGSKSGFTLVELMVVVLILIVVAALALTIGRRAMQSARFTGSISRAHDLGAMVLTYATDHNGELPVWHDYNKGKYWWQLITEDFSTEGGENEMFRSPNHSGFDPEQVAMTISYGWNYPVIGRHKGDSGFKEDHVLRLANFDEPGRVLVLCDGARTNSWGFIDGYANVPDPQRYNGRAAGFILDGSVRTLRTPDEFAPDSKWFTPVRELVR